MQETAGYGTIIRQEISELSARVALTIGDAARAFRLIERKWFTRQTIQKIEKGD